MENTIFGLLLYVDYVVLLSESVENVKQQIKHLLEAAKRIRLGINEKK